MSPTAKKTKSIWSASARGNVNDFVRVYSEHFEASSGRDAWAKARAWAELEFGERLVSGSLVVVRGPRPTPCSICGSPDTYRRGDGRFECRPCDSIFTPKESAS